ncbi:MAG: hypothetical protein ACI8RD_003109, partial [Bacillariaceae sp.]|jgi:hypothetical protein
VLVSEVHFTCFLAGGGGGFIRKSFFFHSQILTRALTPKLLTREREEPELCYPHS